jgi:hypothetical protein
LKVISGIDEVKFQKHIQNEKDINSLTSSGETPALTPVL